MGCAEYAKATFYRTSAVLRKNEFCTLVTQTTGPRPVCFLRCLKSQAEGFCMLVRGSGTLCLIPTKLRHRIPVHARARRNPETRQTCRNPETRQARVGKRAPLGLDSRPHWGRIRDVQNSARMIFQSLFTLSAWETGCTQKSLGFPACPGNL